MKAIICGGRDYQLSQMDYDWLSDLAFEIGFDEIVTGGASGADRGAERWAWQGGFRKTVFNPNWKRYGKAAGPIRNRQMLDYVGDNAVVIAFPGGRGTADIKRQALERELKVIER